MAEEKQSGQYFMCVDGKQVPTDKAGLFLVFPPKSTDFFEKWNAMNGRIVLAQELLSRKGSLDNDGTRKTIENAYIERKTCHTKLMFRFIAPEINLGRGASWLVCMPAATIGIEVWSDEDFEAERKFLDEQKLPYAGEMFTEEGSDAFYSEVDKEKVQSDTAVACLEGYKREMYRLYQLNAKK